MPLFHYTCDHGRDAIGTEGFIAPPRIHSPEVAERYPEELAWLADVVWLTNQPHPDPIALGLTSEILDCDRTRWRYRVTDSMGCESYMLAARSWLPRSAWQLTVGDHRPGLWWVARGWVPVELDPA